MLNRDNFVVYGGVGNHSLDADVLRLVNNVTNLGLQFSHCWYNTFPDGEPGFRIENPEIIQGRHVFIFSCPISARFLNELKDLITACKYQYFAKSTIVILSFLCFRRQDRHEVNHEITRLRWFIRDLKQWGTDTLIVCEPHSVSHVKRYADEFGIKLWISDPTRLFADAIRDVVQTLGGAEKVRIYSPDFGSVGRAFALARLLGLGVIATPKRRINTRVEIVSAEDFLKPVRLEFGADVPISCDVNDLCGLHLFMREDEIDSGTTAVFTSRMLHMAGAESVSFIATHPVCSRGWKMRIFPFNEEQPFRAIWLGNTRPRGDGETEYEGSTGSRVNHVDIAPAIAETLVEVLRNMER